MKENLLGEPPFLESNMLTVPSLGVSDPLLIILDFSYF